jgi:hypothetical protein
MSISEKRKIFIISILFILGLALSVYMQSKGYETVYTHLFYIPIILAGMWWPRKGLIVSLGFSIGLILIHLIINPGISILSDVLRGIMFIIVGLFTSSISSSEEGKDRLLKSEIQKMRNISKEMVKKNKELIKEHARISSINAELEKWKKLIVNRELKMAELKQQISKNNPK